MNQRKLHSAALMLALLGLPMLAPGQIIMLQNPAAQPAQQPAANASATEAVNLVFLGAKQPVLIRINLLVDGKSARESWNEYVAKWFRHLDTKDTGMLSEEDLKYAPNDQGMLQIVRQGSLSASRMGVTLAQMGKKDGEKVTLAEFQAYYAKLVPPIQVNAETNKDTRFAEAGKSLFKALDTNNDGKLSKDEILAARTVLRKFDLDDDEWVTTRELAPNVNNNNGFNEIAFSRLGGRSGPSNSQINDAFLEVRPGEDRLGKVLLERYDRDKVKRLTQKDLNLDKETFAKLDKNGDGSLDENELNAWHERAADLEFAVRTGKNEGVELVKTREGFANHAKATGGVCHVALEDCQFNLTSKIQNSNGPFVFFNQQNGLPDLFQQAADAKKQDFVELKDLEGQTFRPLSQAFGIIDRDRDGKVTLKEIQAFVKLQEGGDSSFVSLTLADQGRVLFQMLDTNADGRLSQRELLNAWTRLKTLDKNNTGFVTEADLVRHFEMAIQKGSSFGGFGNVIVVANGMDDQRPAPQPRYPEGTPDWFRKMDKNGDGDISPAEFLGSREEFDRVDTDRDGLISPEEAIAFDAMRRKNK